MLVLLKVDPLKVIHMMNLELLSPMDLLCVKQRAYPDFLLCCVSRHRTGL